MVGLKSFVVGLLVLFVLVSGSVVWGVEGVDGVVAWAAIGEAEGAVVECYVAVREAGDAGADVSGLLVVLDGAGALLSRAFVEYDRGEFGLALEFAVWCRGNLSGVVEEAGVLRRGAVAEGNLDFAVNVVGSGAGAVIVVVSGCVVWFLYGKRGRLEG